MKCITLTLNPAFDRHLFVPDFMPYRENLAVSDNCDAGGKGINISRALCVGGIDNLAVVVLGRENEAAFSESIKRDGLRFLKLSVDGRVRENLTVHTNGAETRISLQGFCCDDTLLDAVYDAIYDEIGEGTVVTFTGRVPSGITMPAVMRFLDRIREKGARTVIDSRSFTELRDIINARPWLIKPNQEEISAYLARDVKDHSEIVDAAREIHAAGVENVMVTLGARGAMLVCEDGIYTAVPPMVDVRSSIGAGDSSIGGFIAATLEGCAPDEALRRSVAYGSAACMTEGTLPPRACDIDRILSSIKLEKYIDVL